ncbi:hypothetical protein [Schlesneria paludicola]|uniref:hypothetical protein n=1 Tax=Schlesneria paludicola TaxID=360056 RepID=UPI00029B0703|nr:hypothetical protein [Schlesneria paludicola]
MDFRWKPNLGGWLTILNCAAWPVLISNLQTAESPVFEIVIACLFLVGLPFAWILLLPSAEGGPTYNGVVMVSIVVGMNSFAWGYGLATIARLLFKQRVCQHARAAIDE